VPSRCARPRSALARRGRDGRHSGLGGKNGRILSWFLCLGRVARQHFVRYIALYINDAEISRAYLHPVFSFPKVTFAIASVLSALVSRPLVSGPSRAY